MSRPKIWSGRTWAGWVEQSEVADAVRRAARGERPAWDTLVTAFSQLIWAIATSYRLGPADAGEVVQGTWLRAVENLDRIREPERFGGWLATTARHEALRLLRLRGRELVTGDDGRFERPEPDSPTPEDVLLDRDRDRRLWAAFAQLDERCRRLLQLVVVVRPPYAEVAAALDMPIGSIGPTRARCLDKLRRLLVADEVPDPARG
ncbi:MAG TPA: sigma-70 family RNA polymerase sigma factor [Pseudonocardia sp.]|nr:sigma-70 family RNA polymerase sigma factor [Pseudonocardia sp.]